MVVSTHRIAEIEFYIESDLKVSRIARKLSKRYKTEPQEPEITINIYGFNYFDLTLPSLTSLEKEQIRKCISPLYLGRGGLQSVPLRIYYGDENKFLQYFTNNESTLDFPILQLPRFRSRLLDCFNHIEQVFIIIHPLLVEIRDYIEHRIDIFMPNEMQSNLYSSWRYNGSERIYRVFLPDFDALMVHSAAVKRNEKAVLFLAPDEGGKTSVAKQVPTKSVLGDDQVILRKKEGRFLAYSTPWGRIVNDPFSAPLGGIFLIEKSSYLDLIPIKPREVIEFIWEEQRNFTDALPINRRTHVFNLVSEAVHQVPLYKLRTPLNGVDWTRIDACL
jgi:hypothetical protein